MANFSYIAPEPQQQQFSLADIDQAAQRTALGNLAITQRQNQLADLASLHEQGQALLRRDPTALGNVLAMDPSISGPVIGSLDALGQNDIRLWQLRQQMPQLPYGGGPALPGGMGGGSASPTGGYLSRIIGDESGGNPNAKNPRSTAAGAGQFTDGTWLSLLPSVAPEYANLPRDQQLALRSDPGLSARMIAGYAQQNAPRLAASGLPVNDATLALAHRYGPDGATKLLRADPSAQLSDLLGGDVMAANPNLAGRTVGQDVAGFQQRYGSGLTVPGLAQGVPAGRGMQISGLGGAAPPNALALPQPVQTASLSNTANDASAPGTVANPFEQAAAPNQATVGGGAPPPAAAGLNAPSLPPGVGPGAIPPGARPVTNGLGQPYTQGLPAGFQYYQAPNGQLVPGRIPGLPPEGVHDVDLGDRVETRDAYGRPIAVQPKVGRTSTAEGVAKGIPGIADGTPGHYIYTIGKPDRFVPSMSPAQAEEQKYTGEALGKLPDEYRKAADTAQEANSQLDQMMIAAQHFPMGPLAERAENAKAMIRGLAETAGIATPDLDKEVGSYQDFAKQAGLLRNSIVKQVSSRAAVQEFNSIAGSLPSAETSPRGFANVVAQMQGVNDYHIARQQASAQWKKASGTLEGFSDSWNRYASPMAFALARMGPDQLDDVQQALGKIPGGAARASQLTADLKTLTALGIMDEAQAAPALKMLATPSANGHRGNPQSRQEGTVAAPAAAATSSPVAVAPSAPAMSAQDAVAQAQAELSGQLGSLSPQDANDLVTKRAAELQRPGAAPQQPVTPRIQDDAGYAALPSGATFIAPDGKTRRKP